jgi:sodium-dependent dicarboxylate transporter 2/3/5
MAPLIGGFGVALMLAIAYSASICGTGSLVGTPPNMVFVGMVKTMYPQARAVTFVDWMEIGIPFVLCMLPATCVFFDALLWRHRELLWQPRNHHG